MTALFRRIKPAQKFRITNSQIAKFLRIPESLIVKVEFWPYLLYVHRKDRGGQFISYRQLLQWKNAIACQIQKCSTWQEIQHLWNAILHDYTKHNKQYDDSVLPFLENICVRCREAIPKGSQKLEGILIF
jgi:predicted peptidase